MATNSALIRMLSAGSFKEIAAITLPSDISSAYAETISETCEPLAVPQEPHYRIDRKTKTGA